MPPLPLSPFLRRRAGNTTSTASAGQDYGGGGGGGVPDEHEHERKADWEGAKMVLEQNEEEFNKLEVRCS